MNIKQRQVLVRKLLSDAENLAKVSAKDNIKAINALIDEAYEAAGERTMDTEVIRDEIHDFGNKVMRYMFNQFEAN
jgi:hypothetical protein